jgi:class 3 adenylate cyclase
VADALQEFLTGERAPASMDRILATLLFVDVVGSTEHAVRAGDRAWRERLETIHATARSEIDRMRGELVQTLGDGFLATFDGPARATRCALSIRASLGSLGVEVRAGVHTGEIERTGSDVAGIAVHVAARVMEQAGPGEVWASSTVRDLVSGSGIAFTDRGPFRLKGLARDWQLWRVEAP